MHKTTLARFLTGLKRVLRKTWGKQGQIIYAKIGGAGSLSSLKIIQTELRNAGITPAAMSLAQSMAFGQSAGPVAEKAGNLKDAKLISTKEFQKKTFF